MKISIKKQSGFTLLELLVVTFIIGALSSIAIVNLRAATNKARIAAARADMNAMAKGIDLLCDDTGLLPFSHPDLNFPYANNPERHPCDTCVGFDVPANMDECHAGLACNNGQFSNWKGPYVNHVPLDPWGNKYILDFDFKCSAEHGCENFIFQGPYPKWNTVRALVSAGPNGDFEVDTDDPFGSNHLDDVVYILCDY